MTINSMVKSAQYQVALASIVAILIGTQSSDAALTQAKVKNPNLKVEVFVSDKVLSNLLYHVYFSLEAVIIL